LIDSTSVEVIVSEKRVHWTLQKELLCHISPFFKAACEGKFHEAVHNQIVLPEEDVDSFELFVQWLYTGHFVKSQDTWTERAWVLGDKLGISAFKDQAMTQLLDEYASSPFFPFNKNVVEYVYTHTTAASKLRILTVDAVVYGFKTMQTSANEYSELSAQGGDFVTEFMGVIQSAFEQDYQSPLEKRGKYLENPILQ